MTIKQDRIAGCAVLVLALVAIMATHEHDLRVRADARIAARDADDAQNQKSAAREAAAITGTPQAVQTIIRYVPMPSAPLAAVPMKSSAPNSATSPAPAPAPEVPQVVEVRKSDFSPEAQQQIPDAPSYAVLTEDQSVAVARQLVQCKADQASLQTCRQDKADLQTVVKGGTFWRRLGRKAKCLAVSGGASALGAWADKQQPARGAMLGATAGGVACEIF